ncbi:MAG: methylase [Acidobacteria bacterium RIFCSPLOWO2_02_FULL_65_29]|nr:MAG: methylase [Acidobacteria bacterium RIFCSPLOWO2_02_FULL_65_29]
MPLSWNEIRDRALAFSREWADASSERAESQSFWNAFFHVFGIERRRVAIFERQVEMSRAGRRLKNGRIDAFWKSVLLIESKSAGADLDRAFAQTADYFDGLAERDLPRYILVCDFQHFRLFDLEAGREWKFALKDLHKHIKRFGFIAGYRVQEIREQDPVNVEAAERMGRLHDQLKASGYTGHELEVFLVRLLFSLFADDTGIFQPLERFRDYLETHTAPDGTDLGMHLAQLFQVLNQPEDRRQKTLDEDLAGFPYVNGTLFEETLPVASFNADMRATLLSCAELDWGKISPAVFGALFQSVMDKKARRNLGAHYTSERNILKLIKPLFMDGLWEEFNKIKNNRNRLFEFHKKLRSLSFLDPACGCGNFLVIAYRELRLLEFEVLRAVHRDPGSKFVDIHLELQLNVDQFSGIEIEEFPAQIAQVALWLMDHQMNVRVAEEFGMYFARIPLKTSPHIVNGNALRIDWNDVVPNEQLSYILGNPPFVGAMVMSDAQRIDIDEVFGRIKGAGVLDYVSAWYLKAARMIQSSDIAVGFVSTSSICQGEQVGLLWSVLFGQYHVHINFAHRTFRWSNEARGVAAVHCIIIGFALHDTDSKRIYEYEDIKGEPHEVIAKNINAYLVDAPDVLLANRDAPICPVPAMRYGNMPRDGGNLLLDEKEREFLLAEESDARPYVRRFVGAEDFLQGFRRYCLWLKDATPDALRRLPRIYERVAKVREFRLASRAASTRKFAGTPGLFCQIAQPDTNYLLVPRHSSETRSRIPVGFFPPSDIVADSCLCVPEATLYHFGIMMSAMHMAWVRYTCGRLKSDYRYSKDIVYNNFPWPCDPGDKQVKSIEEAAQGVLDARAKFPDSALADLYDPLTMPPDLTKAHQALDRAVDAAYGKKSFTSDAERVAFLFELYQRYTSLLPADVKHGRRRGKETFRKGDRHAGS